MKNHLTDTDVKNKLKLYIGKITFDKGVPVLGYDTISASDGDEFSKYFRKKIIDSKTIYNIILEVVTNYIFLSSTQKIDDSVKTISDIKAFKVDEIVNNVFNFIKRLPITYLFTFPLNNNIDGLIKSSIHLSDDNKLLLVDDNDLKTFKVAITDSLFHPGETEMQKGNVVIQVKSRGFVSKFGILKLTTEDPLYLFKIIIGIYLGMGILDIDDKFYRRDSGFLAGYPYRVFDKDKHITTLRESTEDANFINSLVFPQHSFSSKIPNMGSTVFPTKFDIANKDLKKILNVQKFKKSKPKGLDSALTKKLMKDKDKIADHGFQIRNGAYWYYEALKSSQPHAQIVYLVTAFDSLLGIADEKNEKADIVANSIASSAIELEMIKEYITNLYDLRNKIIHGKEALYKLLDNNQKVEIEKHPFVLKLNCQLYLKKYLQKRVNLYSQSISDK